MTDSSKPPLGRRMKGRAPPPPQAPQPAPRRIFRNTVPDGGEMETKENILRPTVDLLLTLPNGHQTSVTEDGSKALMDLLVELCSRYHLNPAVHTLELLSTEGRPLGFKPNMLLGSLNVACVLIKEKVFEEKVVRRPAPKVPEKTVRLMVNYHGSQKAVVRVNPLVPLQGLIPVICDKCEFNPAHVLLLKDGISRRELPLDKSLAELEIKELYVHDQSLESIRSSTTSLGKAEKKGLLGIFSLGRRKNKTEATSMDMDDYDDRVIQNTDMRSNGLSPMTGAPRIEDRPRTLGQSQSVTNVTSMSPKADPKKRRAPALPGAPTPMMEHSISFESNQMSLGAESLQRKRKAPAPPPTSASPDPDVSSSSASSTSGRTPSPSGHTSMFQSTTMSTTTVVTQKLKQAPRKVETALPSVRHASPVPSSPTPSSSTTDSQAVQDSSSELSHSLDDSDADVDRTGSQWSSLSSSRTSGSVRTESATKHSNRTVEELQKSSNVVAELSEEDSSASSSRSETESALNLRLEEVENSRHSAMGTSEQRVPPKPRRFPVEELRHLSPPILSSSPIEPTENSVPQSPVAAGEAAPRSWVHSRQSSTASNEKRGVVAPEEETVSLRSSSSSSSSSSGSSLPDQGYAASEDMAEGEDYGLVSSPSDTHPTSPDGSLSLNGSGRDRREKMAVRDNSSDSDEGCATWGSRRRHKDMSPKAKLGSFEDPALTAELHQTLADLDANLEDNNEVPVSVVDVDVPVTAIDEVVDDYECKITQNVVISQTNAESSGSKTESFHHQFSTELQNKNNNAHSTAAGISKSSSAAFRQLSQPEKQQQKKSADNKSKGEKKKDRTLETKMKEIRISNGNSVKMEKHKTTSDVKSDVDMQKLKSPEIKHSAVKGSAQFFPEKTSVDGAAIQRSVAADAERKMHRVDQYSSDSNTSHGKITQVTSRFGMKTFTVVPPKPALLPAATKSAVTTTHGAIKIDDQGNMVKRGISHTRLPSVRKESESDVSDEDQSPLHGKAKAFWSLNDRQESDVPTNKGLIDKAKDSTDGPKSPPIVMSETAPKSSPLTTVELLLRRSAERVQSKDEVEGPAVREPVKDIRVEKEELVEVHSKISAPKYVQQPINKPALPPSIPPEVKKDLSFLKPSKRTSSQYVASAINRYTPKSTPKPIFNYDERESSASLKTQGFERSGQSIQVNSFKSSQSVLSDNKENGFKPSLPGPKRSTSYPDYVSDARRDFREQRFDGGAFTSSVETMKGKFNSLEAKTTETKSVQSIGFTQMNTTANTERDNIKRFSLRGPNSAQSSPVHPSAKPPTAPKTIFQGQTSTVKDMTKEVPRFTPVAQPQPSVTVVDSGDPSGPQPVTVFGPVQKFKPVIQKSVEKESSLHSSLMEAIQTGGGRERLKKMNTSGPGSMRKVSYVQEENEKSALLAAIRAPTNYGRLRKIKSEAAVELEMFRKASEEEDGGSSLPPFSPSSSSWPQSPPPVFSPPPPPPAPVTAPPPPPPALPQVKPNVVAHTSANAPMNAASAREAMLEAIRSGSAAERLKRVAVPTKTVQVNGRLGTIHRTSSTLP
ncbi:uncharacterized protein V6R79_011088 [Siganus canaliculatus]